MYHLNEIQDVIKELGLPDEFFIRRRVARALSMPDSEVEVEQSRVHSQASPVWYNVSFNGGSPSCTCPDGYLLQTSNCFDVPRSGIPQSGACSEK